MSSGFARAMVQSSKVLYLLTITYNLQVFSTSSLRRDLSPPTPSASQIKAWAFNRRPTNPSQKNGRKMIIATNLKP